MGTTAYSTEEIATVSAEKQQEQNIITPIDTKEDIAEEIPELNEPVSKDGQRPSILIVEDNVICLPSYSVPFTTPLRPKTE